MIPQLIALAALIGTLEPLALSRLASTAPTFLKETPAAFATLTIETPSTIRSIKALPQAALTTDEHVTRTVWVTAYSSTPEETDETPFITASGTSVRDGIIASNFLEFGTIVMIPELFGEKTFVVEDRMHPRKTNFVDVWMPSKEAALRVGINETHIIILGKELSQR